MESALTKGGSLVDDLNARCDLFIKVHSVRLATGPENYNMGIISTHCFHGVFFCCCCCLGCPHCTHCESLGAYYHEHAPGFVQTADQGCCFGPV